MNQNLSWKFTFYDRLDNLYGEEIRVEFLDRVRDEKKISYPKDLVLQLKKDKKYCLSIMNKYNWRKNMPISKGRNRVISINSIRDQMIQGHPRSKLLS